MVCNPKVTVIGGGLAGLSASVKILANLDSVDLQLIEKSLSLGGRTKSIDYKGTKIDVGQHLHISGFEQYKKLLAIIGLSNKLYTQGKLLTEFRDETGTSNIITSACLPAPFHLLPSFIKYPFLSPKQKLEAIIPSLQAILQLTPDDNENMTFGDWLRASGVSQASILRFWDSFITPTLNASSDKVSIEMGTMIVKRVLLNKHNGKLGYLTAPLSKIGERSRDFIETSGGQVTLEEEITSVDISDSSLELSNNSGETFKSDIVVAAVPAYRLENIVTQPMRNFSFQAFWDLTWNPIINIHLFYDRPVMHKDFFCMITGIESWVFNVHWDQYDAGTHLCVSISNPGDRIRYSSGKLVKTATRQLEKVLPKIENAQLVEDLVIKEQKATILTHPGSNKLRPPAETKTPNLFLAGDWTDTGWPSTMESAVRSGFKAADKVIQSLG